MLNKGIKIGILSFSDPSIPKKKKKITSTGLLKEAIKSKGHIPVEYNAYKCQLYFSDKQNQVFYKNEVLKPCDILIPRLDQDQNVDLEISIIKQFQLMGIKVLNDYLSTSKAKNKLRTLQLLHEKKIPMPRSIIVRKLEYLDGAIEKVGGYPIILKTPFGTWGRGVVIVESRRSLYSALDLIWYKLSSNIMIIQEYIAESSGIDYRAFVVGGKVVAAMKRTAQEGEFRANLHQGGEGKKIYLTKDEQKIAIKATKTLGLDIGGVDILRAGRGSLVIEVNACPGLTGITAASKVDVAGKIVDYAVSLLSK